MKMLVVALGHQPDLFFTSTFNDVSVSRWSQPYIESAIRAGILIPDEYPGRRFLPAKSITRGEAAQMAARALGGSFLSSGDAPAFVDVQPGDSIAAAVRVAAAERIVRGFPDGTFRPQLVLTRAQAAAIIARTMRARLTQRAVSEMSLGWWADAAESLDAASRIDPDDAPTFVVLGTALANTGLSDAAIAAFERALELGASGALAGSARESLGILYFERGDYSNTARHLTALGDLRNGELYLRRAAALAWLGRFKEARADAARAKTMNPELTGLARELEQVIPKPEASIGQGIGWARRPLLALAGLSDKVLLAVADSFRGLYQASVEWVASKMRTSLGADAVRLVGGYFEDTAVAVVTCFEAVGSKLLGLSSFQRSECEKVAPSALIDYAGGKVAGKIIKAIKPALSERSADMLGDVAWSATQSIYRTTQDQIRAERAPAYKPYSSSPEYREGLAGFLASSKSDRVPAGIHRHSGSRVWQVQRKLQDLGYYKGPVDGIIGPATKAALEVFRKERGLPEGAEEADLLAAVLNSKPSLPAATIKTGRIALEWTQIGTQKEVGRWAFYELFAVPGGGYRVPGGGTVVFGVDDISDGKADYLTDRVVWKERLADEGDPTKWVRVTGKGLYVLGVKKDRSAAYLQKFDVESGRFLWRTDLPFFHVHNYAGVYWIATDSAVFIRDYLDYAAVIDGVSGTVAWYENQDVLTKAAAAQGITLESDSAQVLEGRILYSSGRLSNGTPVLFKYDILSKQALTPSVFEGKKYAWNPQVNSYHRKNLVIGEDSLFVFLQRKPAEIVKYNPDSGASAWRRSFEGWEEIHPLDIRDGVILAVAYPPKSGFGWPNGILTGISSENGAVLWSHELGNDLLGSTVLPRAAAISGGAAIIKYPRCARDARETRALPAAIYDLRSGEPLAECPPLPDMALLNPTTSVAVEPDSMGMLVRMYMRREDKLTPHEVLWRVTVAPGNTP